MNYEIRKDIYFSFKDYAIEKLKGFNFYLQSENEIDQPFGSFHFEMTSKMEDFRFIFDNRESWYSIEIRTNNKPWNSIYTRSIDDSKDKILGDLKGKLNNHMRLDLL